MEQMAELVENGLHFAMRQERRPGAEGRCQVAADQAQVRLERARLQAVGHGAAGDQGIHPGTAALVFARVPVGIKAAQESAVPIMDIVVADLRVPYRHAGPFGYPDAVQPVDQVEKSGQDAVEREVRAERLLVKVVQ